MRSGHGELVHANHKFVGKFNEDKVGTDTIAAKL